MRPIVCVCSLGSRTFCAASPRSPPKERGQLMLLCIVGQCTAGDGVFGAACCENIGVVLLQLFECRCAISAQCNAIARGVVRIGPHLTNQASVEDGLLVRPKSFEICRAGSDGPAIQQDLRLPVEPIGAPIGRNVGSMTPYCPDLLSTDRLPHPLPI